jgi:acetyl coenzyme A synthetase (ADP forming)-like protein
MTGVVASRAQPPAASPYPERWVVDALLSDGAAVCIRPIRPDDGAALSAFHDRLSEETVYRRFFSYKPHLTEREVERFTQVDYRDRMAFVAVLGGELIGVGRYDRTPGTDEAEVAFVVADAHRGRGLGSLFLEYLAAAARDCGIARFVAETLAFNREMLHVFRAAGFQEVTSQECGEVTVRLDIRPTDHARMAAEAREWSADVLSVSRLLRPRSIAVVGAGRREGSVGRSLVGNLRRSGFRGPIYPVNPHASEVEGLSAYQTIGAIPHPVDVAVIAVPPPAVLDAVDACAAQGVHGLVVVTSGFSETGPEGAALERRLVEHAHLGGMRIIGPNCLGVINTDAGVRMNATFATRAPVPGTIAFASQSGALGIAMLERAEAMGLGMSSFVSMGNKADVSGNDLLRYWEQDEQTRVILLYLESFGNPRTFSRVARRVSRSKPIVAVKAGRSAAGARAATSHTAALAAPDTAVDALFRQSGVIRVDTLEQLFDVGAILAHQPLPRGGRVAIVGNAGGAGILAADALVRYRLEAVELDAAVQAALRTAVPSAADLGNPVDLGAGADAEAFRKALAVILGAAQVDAVIAVYAPVPGAAAEDVALAVAAAAAESDKPVLATFLGMDAPPAIPGAAVRVPCFAFPEPAAQALAAVTSYARWRARPEGLVTVLAGVDPEEARRVVAAELDGRPDGAWLDQEAACALLATHGITAAHAIPVGSVEEAVTAARSLGFPVALKVRGQGLLHKTEVGGVHLDLRDAAAVRAAYAAMARSAGAAMEGGIVQAMAPAGVEAIVGVVHDPVFGPLLMFGSGGVAVELFGDRAFRSLPLTDVDARELVRSIRAAPLLFGHRGAQPVDVPALEELLLRVARLAEDVPEIAEMDLNPLIVSPRGVSVVDLRVRLSPVTPHPELTVRRLLTR